MEVVNPQSALLSNFEVLTLLRELEADHLARTKTALRIKKEEEATRGISSIVPGVRHPRSVEISENLRTIEVEAIQYLSADFQPTSRQSPQGITTLVKELAKYDLTRAEKLQVVNLAPSLPVELYVIVEELEDRLGQTMDNVLELVRSSLDNSNPLVLSATVGLPDEENGEALGRSLVWDDQDTDGDVETFDDTGEGVGVEGDLDIEEE